MNKLKTVKAILSGVVYSTSHAADGWHFLRTAVSEFHGLLQALDKAVVDFEGRLAELEAEALSRAGNGEAAVPASGKRAVRKKAVKKAAKTASPRKTKSTTAAKAPARRRKSA